MVSLQDLKVVVKTLTGADAGTDLGIGVVPWDKQRFIYGVTITCPTVSNTVTLGEATAAATTLATDKFERRVSDFKEYPADPDPDKPLFSISGGKYLGAVGISGVTDTKVQILYYDF